MMNDITRTPLVAQGDYQKLQNKGIYGEADTNASFGIIRTKEGKAYKVSVFFENGNHDDLSLNKEGWSSVAAHVAHMCFKKNEEIFNQPDLKLTLNAEGIKGNDKFFYKHTDPIDTREDFSNLTKFLLSNLKSNKQVEGQGRVLAERPGLVQAGQLVKQARQSLDDFTAQQAAIKASSTPAAQLQMISAAFKPGDLVSMQPGSPKESEDHEEEDEEDVDGLTHSELRIAAGKFMDDSVSHDEISEQSTPSPGAENWRRLPPGIVIQVEEITDESAKDAQPTRKARSSLHKSIIAPKNLGGKYVDVQQTVEVQT